MTDRYIVKCDRAAFCGCRPGYLTQGSLIPFRHKHVRVALTAEQLSRLGAGELVQGTEPAPRRARPLGGYRSRLWSWLEGHRLTAHPRGIGRRARRPA